MMILQNPWGATMAQLHLLALWFQFQENIFFFSLANPFNKLAWLGLHGSTIETLSFWMCHHIVHLRVLDLSRCEQLCSLHLGVQELHSLLELNLSYYRWLQNLPNVIGELHSLLKLNLSCFQLQKIPDAIGEFHSLLELNLTRCKALQNLPRAIGELHALKKLNLDSCPYLYNHYLFLWGNSTHWRDWIWIGVQISNHYLFL